MLNDSLKFFFDAVLEGDDIDADHLLPIDFMVVMLILIVCKLEIILDAFIVNVG